MNNPIFIILLFGIFTSCGEAVTKKKTQPNPTNKKVNSLSKNVKYIDSLVEPNGLKIKWAFKGKGAPIERGDVIVSISSVIPPFFYSIPNTHRKLL